jgi:nitric oxide reductase subunit B
MSTVLRKNGAFGRSEKILLVMMASALSCVVLSLLFGALGALYYVPGISAKMVRGGVSLVQLRPLHTSFASAWLFLGAATGAYKYLFDTFGEPNDGDMRRFRAHMVCWGLAGLGVLITLSLGITSGREYIGFHPSISAAIWLGWALFAWTFFSKVRRGFFARPVYVYMWSVGILFFLYTFAEGHAWLLPFVRQHPVADLQIQWKSCGTLVASFNQMVYGCLIFVAVKKTGDERIAQSPATFGLFGIGLLNSFTNYTHHTYHLPQMHIVKWTAFVVSMLEIIILAGVFREVTAALTERRRLYHNSFSVTDRMFALSKRWNLFLLTLAIAISVPSWNALVHGTHVIMAHAMGSELAIDTYILLGVFAFLLATIFPKRETREQHIDGNEARWTIAWLNLCLIGLVSLLLASGFTTAVHRYFNRPMPAWLEAFPVAFVFLGLGLAWFVLRFLAHWLPLFRRPGEHKAWAALD